MAAMIVITCPECKKQLKGPADLKGKRVRCKSCGQIFTVQAPAPSKAASAASKAPGKQPAKQAANAKQAAPPAARQEDEEGKNPYQVTEFVLASRCPQCAAEMESEEAVICLNCGYNTRTRQRMTTIRTYAHTPLDWALWLAPGILCAVAVLALIGLVCFLVIPAGFTRVAGDAWWGHFSVPIYGSVFALVAGWIAGKYAYRRLVLNPRPPEKYKRG